MLDLRTARLKPVEFIGGSKRDLSGLSRSGQAGCRTRAVRGGRAPNVKTLQGFGGAGIVEIIEDHEGDTYRCVYATRLKRAIYVLHALQKKSKRGRRTPKQEIDLVKTRLKEAKDRDRQAERSQ